MPRILRARYPARYTDDVREGSFVLTRPGVYWEVQQRESSDDGLIVLTLLPVDGHDVPDDVAPIELPRPVGAP